MRILLRRMAIILVCSLVFAGTKAQAAPGNLDFNFGIQGLVLTDPHDILTGTPGINAALAVAIHPPGDPNEGKIVAVGFTQTAVHDFTLARYNPDGSLDTSFGTNGVIETDIAGDDLATAALIYPPGDPNAGKILAAGTSIEDPPNSFALARYCPNGALDDGANCGDQAFGSGGTVTTELGSGDSRVLGLAFQADGKIVAAGYSEADGTRDFALARYNSDGSLDGTFNPAGSPPGTVLTDFAGGPDEARGVAVYPAGDANEGKILAAGFATEGEENLAFARYCPDGSLDSGSCGGSAFNSTGERVIDVGDADQLTSLALQADGKAVGAGFANNGSDDDVVLVRVCGDGSLDDGSACGAGFGSGGIVVTEAIDGSADKANALAIQADGKILAAGSSDANGFGDDFALLRYGSGGDLDFGFGQAGIVLQDFSCLCSDSAARSMALQTDGKIVLSGASDAGSASAFNNFALARFLGDSAEPFTPTADLAVTLSADPADAQSGDLVTFTAVVTNQGPDAVSEVTLSTLLLGSFSGLAAAPETCTIGEGAVSCALGELDNGASATVTLNLKVAALPFSLVSTVSGSVIDSNNANNQAALTLVNPGEGGGDGGCRLNPRGDAKASPVWLGLLFTISLLLWARKLIPL